MSYTGKVSVFKPLVPCVTVYGSMTGTLTSILSLGEERRLTVKTIDLKVLSWVLDVGCMQDIKNPLPFKKREW